MGSRPRTEPKIWREALSGTLCAMLFLGASAANAATLVYFEENGGGGNPRGFYDFDTGTGVSTLRATVGGSQRFFGMDVRPSDGTVFAADIAGDVYTVDIDTGGTSLVGASGLVGSMSPVGLAFDPGTDDLFGLSDDGVLYGVDQSTGAFAAIGPSDPVIRGISFDPLGTLYGFTGDGTLYTVDTGSATATLVGGSGYTVDPVTEDSTFTPDGRLFGTDFSGSIFESDPATGNRVLVSGTGMGGGLLGLIAEPALAGVPEPASLLLTGLGLLVLGTRAPRTRPSLA